MPTQPPIVGLKFPLDLAKDGDPFLYLLVKALDEGLDPVFAALPSGKLCYVNLAACRRLGYDQEELLDMEIRDIDPEATPARWASNWAKVKREGSATMETIEVARDGSRHPVEVTATYVAHGDLELLVGNIRDLTERRSSEEALRLSQKMESLGLLAGGIAHDFNNLLTAIMGNLNLAQACLEDASEAAPFLETVEKTLLRAADLTKQLLAYSGRGQFQVMPQDLNQVVREIVHLMKVSIPKGISLRLHLGKDLPPVEADAAQIQQVIMNLVSNASEAIGHREGFIIVGTRFVDLDTAPAPLFIQGQSLKPGRYVVLDVSDTGCGMPPEVQERIFDPFFTTKPSGRGLGLSAMLGILRGHGAGIKIRSEKGRGSTFELFFPASKEEIPPPSPWERPQVEAFTGKVLLVDDEDIVLESTGAALSAMGFEVIQARNGIQALERFEEHWQHLRLVLMDVTMPRMDGRKAFRVMHRTHPGIPVLLSSGYDRQASVEGVRLTGLAGFLQKPYRIPELRKAAALALETVR